MRPRPALPALLSLLSLLSLALIASAASAQPTEPAAPSPKKDKEPVKKQELPKPPPPIPASEITLKVGDKAPAFKPDVWIKTIPVLPPGAPSANPTSTPAAPPAPTDSTGPATLTFDPSKVYVVEFWATWCASCREALPALAKLQRASKDLVVIAVASSERKPAKDGADDRLEGVRRFVNGRPESFPHAVVFDGSRAIAKNWITAAGHVYIPAAFVIDPTGTITWIGDPRESGFEIAVNRALKTLPQPKPPEPVTPDPKKKPTKPRSKN